MYPSLKEIHFVGIGGIGMSGLAEVLLTMGCRVTGSDLRKSPLTDRLRRRGARIFVGHRAENVGQPQVVVTSSAISPSNPEIGQARSLGIPVIARGEMLAELMRLKYGIAVAGSHGKTTTTSLIAAVLSAGRLDPTVVIGGQVKGLRSNARLGKGDYLVAEADESDGSFLHLSPTIAVVTNIDREHMDHYRDFDSLRKTFEEFSLKIPFYGLSVFCADHPETASLASRFPKRSVTYGLQKGADYQAREIRILKSCWGSQFEVRHKGEVLGRIDLPLPGRHNVLNSLAAVAVGRELDIRFTDIRRALAGFRGIGRRLERVCDGKILILDDYGHHPEEVAATLAAVRSVSGKRRLWVLFQPHRYTRTKDLFDDFVRVLERDRGERTSPLLVLTEIYPAGEEPIAGVSGGNLAEALRKKVGGVVTFVPKVTDMADVVLPQLRDGDVVLTLGAGDIWKVGRELARRIPSDE